MKFSFINLFILNIINFFLRCCLYSLRYFIKSINYLYVIISNLKNYFIPQKKYRFKSHEEIQKFLLKNELGNTELIYFPKIHNLSLGGEIKVYTKGIQIYVFENISFTMNSDFIRFNDKSIFCDKISRFESRFIKFGDVDFIKFTENEYSLIKYKKNLYFDYVFHLTGCFSKVWTHFLVQFYPKLAYIHLLPKNDKIAIILPNDIDTHIISLIDHFIKKLENVEIVLVDNDIEINCKKVMYVSNDTWLSDIGIIPTIFHIQISDQTVNFILNQAKKLIENITSRSPYKRLFIGRTGKRNIENYHEVLEFYESNDFIEIFPHLLSLNQKLELFSSAEIIVGPLSSGFANMIFCSKKPIILTMANQSRHDDMFFTKFAHNLGINYQTFIGKESTPGNQDSDYYIDIVELNKHFSSLISSN